MILGTGTESGTENWESQSENRGLSDGTIRACFAQSSDREIEGLLARNTESLSLSFLAFLSRGWDTVMYTPDWKR